MTCTRDDGTQTWTHLHPGIEDHDLAHFALESEMGWENAFFGLVAQGYQVGDFELPREKRPSALIPANLSSEAKLAECIVGLMQVQRMNSGTPEEFLTTLGDIIEERNLHLPPRLNSEKMEQVWRKYLDLLQQWRVLSPGEAMYLEFTT